MAPLDFNAPTKEKAEIRRRKAAITRCVKREVIAECCIDKLPLRGARTLVTGAQGTGKSRTVAESIAELLAGTAAIWWLVPTLAKAEEQVADYERLAGPEGMPALIVRGRGAADPARDAEPMCPRHLVVNRAAAMRVNVQEAICENGCPLQSSCGYQAQKRRSKPIQPGSSSWRPTISGCLAMRHTLIWWWSMSR